MTATERAIAAFFERLRVAALAPDAPLPVPSRDLDIAVVLQSLDDESRDVRMALNLRDGDATVTGERFGNGAGVYELVHRMELEWLVESRDSAKRIAAFDAGMDAIGTIVETVQAEGAPMLGGAVDDIAFERVLRSNQVTDGAPQIKAATIVIAVTFTSSRPF